MDTAASAPGFMDRIARLAGAIGDRADPMLVRCVRQELRSKAFIGIFSIALLIAVIATIAVAGFAKAGDNSGKGLFGAIAMVWSFALCVVQSNVTARTVNRERSDDTWDLVELTGQGPWTLVRGMWLANLVQSQLYTAALAPFLVMAYFLNGVDILTIVATLVLIPMAGAATGAVAVLATCQGNNPQARAGISLVLGIGLVIATLSFSSMAFLGSNGIEDLLSELGRGRGEAWVGLAAMVNAWGAFLVSCLVLGTASLTHRAADRSRGPRLLAFALFANAVLWLVVVGAWAALFEPGGIRDVLRQGAPAVGLFGVLLAGTLGFWAVSEDRELTPAQLRSVTGKPWSWALGPGSDRGRLAFVSLLTVSLGFAMLALFTDPSSRQQTTLLVTVLIAAYLCIWFAAGDGLVRAVFAPLCRTPAARRAGLLAFLAAWALLPPLTALFLESGYQPMLFACSPISGLTLSWSDTGQDVLALCVVLAGATAFAILVAQGSRLSRNVTVVRASAGDRNPRGA